MRANAAPSVASRSLLAQLLLARLMLAQLMSAQLLLNRLLLAAYGTDPRVHPQSDEADAGLQSRAQVEQLVAADHSRAWHAVPQ